LSVFAVLDVYTIEFRGYDHFALISFPAGDFALLVKNACNYKRLVFSVILYKAEVFQNSGLTKNSCALPLGKRN